jgi:hypothetical protein
MCISATIPYLYFKVLEHGKNTRGDGCSLVIPRVKTEVGRKTFKFQGSLLFNKLPKELTTEKSVVTKFKLNEIYTNEKHLYK